MTPPLRWVFLLALVGCAASVPSPPVDDACVLLCHPRARSSPEGVCELRAAQSGSVLDQARIIVSRCLKLCDHRLPSSVRVSCSTLRSFLGAFRGCRCSSSRVMRSNARVSSLVDELAEEIVSSSPLGEIVIFVLHAALSREDAGAEGNGPIVDDYEAASRPIRDAEDEKPRRYDAEQPAVDVDRHDGGTVRLQADQTQDTNAASSSSEDDDSVDWGTWTAYWTAVQAAVQQSSWR
ncbi:uncharacterized protein LOC105187831 [Harpegnathos saltator]|uniref:Uncharacterized protein n=1 Tax=Harpegnathos saltator TaxID=610380 RepID=E2BY31_HARSA|nr:uncharacterized protein LOC105187831 [Harpegnathos saltator]EFN79404.1 hypothetical protein EAI_09475 [Harpegnathos saltator]